MKERGDGKRGRGSLLGSDLFFFLAFCCSRSFSHMSCIAGYLAPLFLGVEPKSCKASFLASLTRALVICRSPAVYTRACVSSVLKQALACAAAAGCSTTASLRACVSYVLKQALTCTAARLALDPQRVAAPQRRKFLQSQGQEMARVLLCRSHYSPQHFAPRSHPRAPSQVYHKVGRGGGHGGSGL